MLTSAVSDILQTSEELEQDRMEGVGEEEGVWEEEVEVEVGEDGGRQEGGFPVAIEDLNGMGDDEEVEASASSTASVRGVVRKGSWCKVKYR